MTVPTPILVSVPAEPLSLAEAKLFLKVDTADDDDLIRATVTAARQYFEAATDRQFTTATWVLKLPGFYPAAGFGWGWDGYGWGAGLSSRIELPNPPLRSVASVEYLDLGTDATLTLDPAVYNVVTSRTPGCVELAFGQTWPVTAIHPEAVTVTYLAGNGSPAEVPELVKQGIRHLVAHWHTHRGDTADVPPAVERIAWACGSKRF